MVSRYVGVKECEDKSIFVLPQHLQLRLLRVNYSL